MAAMICTVAVQIWYKGTQNTLRLNDVQCVEFVERENNEGLLVNCSKDPQFKPYQVLTSMPMRINSNDCIYVNGPPDLSK